MFPLLAKKTEGVGGARAAKGRQTGFQSAGRPAGWLVEYLPVHGFFTRWVDKVQGAVESRIPDITPEQTKRRSFACHNNTVTRSWFEPQTEKTPTHASPCSNDFAAYTLSAASAPGAKKENRSQAPTDGNVTEMQAGQLSHINRFAVLRK
jgi:hypothetical protein